MSVRNIVLLAAVLLLAVCANGFGCVGARPLAMGGAFVGLADDANATYWNPAGLARFDSPKVTAMYTATNRDEINYLGYLAYGGRLTRGGGGYGFSYVSHQMTLGKYGADDQSWFWLSGAFRATADTSVGVNIRFINDSISGVSTEAALDLSFLRVVDEKWSFGLLIQDINEPRIEDDGHTIATHGRNIRPGIAYRYDRNTIVTADIYDLLDHSGVQSLRVGVEKILPSGTAVRAGYYGTGGSGGLTLGVGSRVGRMSVDAALMTGDLDNTLLVSASSKY